MQNANPTVQPVLNEHFLKYGWSLNGGSQLNFSRLEQVLITKTHKKTTFFNISIFCCYREIHLPQAIYVKSQSMVYSSLVVEIFAEVHTFCYGREEHLSGYSDMQ